MKKIILLMFVVLLLIPLVNAADWDNKLAYSNNDLKVTISNSFLLLFPTSEIGTAELKSHTSVNEVRQVGAGNHVVMWYDFNFVELYLNGLGEVEFTAMRTGELIDRDYSFVYWGEKERDVYGEGNCFLNINGTRSCESVVVGKETYETWLPYNSKDIPKGDIRIGLMTYVEIDDKVDGVWTIAGKKVSRHAVWTASLNVGLKYYYAFEEGAGNFLDQVSSNDMIEQGTVGRVAGKIGNGVEFDDNNANFLKSEGNVSIIGATDRSICWWSEQDGYVNNEAFIQWGDVSPTSQFWVLWYNNANALQVQCNTIDFFTGVNTTLNMDFHCLITNGTDWEWWRNGGNIKNHTTAVLNTANSLIYFGNNIAGTYPFDGVMDELGIWNRTLTGGEVVQLYNGGTGITYGPGGLSVFLLSPEDNANITTNTITFTTNVSDPDSVGIQNVTLAVTYPNETSFYNETNTDGTAGIYNFTDVSIPIGIWNWSVNAYDSSHTNYESSVRDFSVWQLFFSWETFDEEITEGLQTIFTANYLTNGSDITSAILYYNATTNTGTINNHGGNNFTVTETITAPSVSANTNISFYWNITQEGLDSIARDSQNQTVLNFGVDNCSVYNYTLYNFTIADEKTQIKLIAVGNNTDAKVDLEVRGFGTTTFITQFNKSYSQINPFAVCLNSNLSSGGKYNIDVQIQYDANGYEIEFYHIQNATINSTSFTTNITLFDLNSTQSQLFKLIVKDSSFLAIKDALVEVYRKYIDEGVFKIVEIPRTDGRGETAAHLVIQDAIYKFVIKKYGVTIATFENVIAVCQTPLVAPCVIDFNAFAETVTVPDFEEAEDFLFTLGFNSTSRVISSVFSIPSGTPSVIAIEVIKEDALGTSVCTDTLTSSSGTLNCDVGTSVGNSTVLAKIYKDGDLQAQGQVKLDNSPISIYGGVLVILALFIMMTLIGAGISDNPVYTVLFLMVGVILLFALNLVASNGFIGASATILWLIVAIILIIIKGGRRS